MNPEPDPLARLLEAIRDARGVIFDFDGTLVDSNEIKRRAFDTCFAEFPDKMDEIRAYCHAFNHTPRWEKFRHVYESILQKPYTAEIDASLHERYAAATTRQVAAAPEIPGAGDFLRQLNGNLWKAVVSSTPDPILKTILRQRGWGDLFNAVRGAPVKKADWILEAGVKGRGLQAEDLLFFGDTIEDQASSRKAGCAFVGVANDVLRQTADHFIPDFNALKMNFIL